MELSLLTITEAIKGLRTKQFSSLELTTAFLERIKKNNSNLNALITITEDEALAQAKESDKMLANGEDLPLLGIPIILKDNYLSYGVRTTAASKVLDDFIPPYDATATLKLKQAGVVMLGKANMDAWAHGSSGENSDFGPAKNPWNTDYVPGGSSSGSAVSVAADLCLMATGSDTGGSIRLPASFCNIVGLKPTYGRVSRYGVVAMASSLDAMGHLTKTVEDSARVLQVTAGKDIHDSQTPDVAVPNYLENLTRGIKGIKIGVPKEYMIEGIDDVIKTGIEQSTQVLKELGAEIIEVSLPHAQYAIACYYIIQPAEVSSNLARYDGIRYGNDREAFADEAKRRIMLGSYTLSAGYYDAYYKKAMQVRTLLKQDYDQALEKVDVILSPVSPTPPWKLGKKASDPLQMYLSDIFTVTANLVGVPALALPMGFANELPIGLQFLAKQFAEPLLFQVGYAYEQATDWHKRKPKL